MHAPSRRLLASALVLLLGAVAGSTASADAEPTFLSTPGPAVGNVLAAQVALVDGDDVPDLVTGVVGEGFLVELGRGDGTYRAPRRYAVPGAAYTVAVGDVTGDGTTDVVALSSGSSPHVVTFAGTGDGSGALERQTSTTTVAPSGYAVALGRFDDDDALDLAVPVGGKVHFYSGTLAGSPATPTGRFAFVRSVPAPSATNVFAPVTTDLNRDGELDLVLPPNGGKVGVLLSDAATSGPYTFHPQVVTGAVSAFDVAVGDLDGAPGDEVAYASGTRAGYLSWTSGTTLVDRAVTTSLTSAAGVSVADYDGDGHGDLGVVTGTSQRFFLGGPAVAPATGRTFRTSTTVKTVDKASHAQTSADVDVDGRPDVVLTSASGRRSTALVNLGGNPSRRAPLLTRQPAGGDVLDGAPLTLTASSTGTPSTVVRWERALPGATTWTELVEGETDETRSGTTLTSTWTGLAERASSGARYRAVFAGDVDDARSSSTDPVVVTVLERTPPAFATAPRDTLVREGDDAVFTTVATGAPAPTVTWAVAAPGATTFTSLPTTGPTLTVADVPSARHGSTYRATLTSSEGTVSRTATLSVDPRPVLVTPPADLAVRPGDTARFSVVSENADVTWQHSTDAGRSWTTLTTRGPVLELSATTAAQHGHRFRARLDPWGASAGTPVLSRAAVLGVDPAPAAPAALTATETSPGRLAVSWSPPASTTDTTGWTVTVDGASVQHAAAVREVTVGGLAAGSHLVEVRALDAVGPGAAATTRVTTQAAGAPASAGPTPRPSTSGTPAPASTAPTSPSRSGTPSPGATGSATPRSSATAPGGAPSSSAPPRTATTRPAPAGPPTASGLTLTGGAAPVVTGGAATLSGTAGPGETVELLGYVRPSTTYTVLRTTTADEQGRFSFTVRPTGNMRAYARTSEQVVSPSVVQRVRAAVSLTATRTSGRGFAFTGVVWPKHAGQLVNLYAVRGTSRSLLGQARTDRRGAYRDTHTFTTAGRTHTVVAVVPRTVHVEPGESVRRAATTRR